MGGVNPGVIHACVSTANPNKGVVRIVGADDACKSNEVALDWNAQGPQGPAGPQGPQGPAGIGVTVQEFFVSPPQVPGNYASENIELGNDHTVRLECVASLEALRVTFFNAQGNAYQLVTAAVNGTASHEYQYIEFVKGPGTVAYAFVDAVNVGRSGMLFITYFGPGGNSCTDDGFKFTLVRHQ